MSFHGWHHLFEGPVPLPEYLKPKPGVFVVWCVHEGTWDIMDAGDADNVKTFLLMRSHLEEQVADRPYSVYFSAAYISDPDERIRLLKEIKGTDFVPFDAAALKGQPVVTEHEKLFAHAKSKRFHKRFLAKLAIVPMVPRQLMRGLVKKTKELESGGKK